MLPVLATQVILFNEYVKENKLSHHPELIEEVFCSYGIQDYLGHYNGNDKTRETNSYHNKLHSYSVALNCLEGALAEGLTLEDTRALLVAALFHDFNHSQGMRKDSDNIEVAIKGVKFAHACIGEKQALPNDSMLKVYAAIRSTKYPYSTSPIKNELSKIIRDADLMMMYELPGLRDASYSGLMYEMNMSEDLGIKEFCFRMYSFTSKLKWQTRWAKNKYILRNYPRLVKEMIFNLESKYKLIY